ncbi:MAG: hypothetical protein FWC66_04890 [Oscillospiraceae bacterium]|nr:hypothetical protein [Oscillospiraceae bacterium]
MQKSVLRKSLALALALFMTLAMFPVASLAATPDETADAMKAAQTLFDLGLFRGTGIDAEDNPIFSLEDQATRIQGLIMFLRFIGAYDRALDGDYDSPFEDVFGTYNRAIVGYAYQRGLTHGVRATAFDPAGDLTATMFLTFMLRALGFEDGVDFQWNNAWVLSDELGITHGEFYEQNNYILRGNMVLIALFLLEQQIVDSDLTLLDYLIESEILTEDARDLVATAISEIRADLPYEQAPPLAATPPPTIGGGGGGGFGPGGGSGNNNDNGNDDDNGDDDIIDDSTQIAFNQARAAALSAITAANLPDAAALYDYTIVVPRMDIATHRVFSNTENLTAADGGLTDYTFHPHMIPFTYWPSVGAPSIESYWGNAPATGIYALIETMFRYATIDYDFAADPDFAAWHEFDELYRPAAMAGTVVSEKQVYILAGNQAGLRIALPEDAADFFVPHRIYQRAIVVNQGPTENLRVADYILAANPPGAPAFGSALLHDHLGRDHGLYDFGFNHKGVAIAFVSRTLTDFTFVAEFTASPAIPGVQGTIRIGQYMNNLFEVAEGANLYTVTTGAGATITPSDWSILAGLPGGNGHGTIRPVFDENGRVIEAYFMATGNTNPTAANQRWSYYLGVHSSAAFPFDTVENPNPVSFALYNPTTDLLNTGANTNATNQTLYPLYIFFHGQSGEANTANFASNNAMANNYTLNNFQDQFETNTPGVSGAFVMAGRSHGARTSTLYGAQGWITGFRGGMNPLYQAGDQSAYGQNTQAAAIVQNVRWLIENYPIDPNRIYLTGHSAGGHQALNVMFASVRLGYPNLFAAVVPSQSAFFPALNRFPAFDADLSIVDGGPNLGIGLQSWLEATAHIPHWMQAARNDGTCRWGITAGDDFELWRRVRDLTGSANGGLTRVTVVVDEKNANGTRAGQHSGVQLLQNNVFASNLWHDGTSHVITDAPGYNYVRLDFMDRVFAAAPYGWQEAYTTATTWRPAGAAAINGDVYAARAHLFSFGKYPQYSSDTDWAGTLIQWLNAAGRFRAGECFADIDKSVPSPTTFAQYLAVTIDYELIEQYLPLDVTPDLADEPDEDDGYTYPGEDDTYPPYDYPSYDEVYAEAPSYLYE